MIELSGVGFSYDQRPVLRDVDIAAGPGELMCIVGPNGAGKTTLLRLMAGIAKPRAGTVRCFELDPSEESRRKLARRLAYLPQSYRIAFPFLTSEIVLMGRYAHGRRSLLGFEDAEDDKVALEAMERCDVLDLADRPFNELSGGEQRRVLLAQALCQKAELILLDEPTASLDPSHAIAVFEALETEIESGGTTAVVVTHDLNLAARFATRLLVIADLTLCADGPPTEVLTSKATESAFAVGMHVGKLPGSDIPFVVPSTTPSPAPASEGG
jgi:iron complex transport system ATP-binding protein